MRLKRGDLADHPCYDITHLALCFAVTGFCSTQQDSPTAPLSLAEASAALDVAAHSADGCSA
jgi:hypothetical protein